MKHASAPALALLEPLLGELRAMPLLAERSAGCFYRKGSAFLHFHEDPAGLFADIKRNGKHFERHRVSSPVEQASFLALVRASVHN
jgi:hypothetical protein